MERFTTDNTLKHVFGASESLVDIERLKNRTMAIQIGFRNALIHRNPKSNLFEAAIDCDEEKAD